MLSIFPRDQRCTTHRQAHRGIIWENSRAFVPEWHRGPLNTGDSANVTVWKHQSVNKTLLCGSKGFQHCRKKREKKQQRLHISPMSKRKRPRVRLKGENCYHYLGKAKKVHSWKKNNQDGYFYFAFFFFFFQWMPLLPCIIKIDRGYNFRGGESEKERGSEGPIVGPAHIKRCDIVAVKW